MEESVLIEKLRKKDQKTQEYFYKTHAKKMFLLCLRFLNDEQEASEVLNDGFYKVFSRIKMFQNGGLSGLKAWMKKIMVNECLQHIRKTKNLEIVQKEGLSDIPASIPYIELDAKIYDQLIRGLPVSYRAVFLLYAIEGYSHKEIAEFLEISENKSRIHLFRARKELQQKIKKINNHGIQ